MFSVQIDAKDLQRKLRAVANGLHNPEPLMNDLSEVMYAQIIKNFEMQGRPPWKKLSPATLARKKGNRKLQEGGEKSEDLMGSFEAGASGNEAWVSNAVTYAAIHNFGGKAGRGRKVTIPARPFINLPVDGRQALADATADFIESLVRVA